ncbi:META domain-containing protein [Taibaiella sp. KBW10]|uniref:META domain-containing protein n=1 Tax=Taibaiella sp. KBW10 TaxID=2153357 RepID=UPI0013150D00|nr:META domain-containing protein [Taibaiella sp. KBW10]
MKLIMTGLLAIGLLSFTACAAGKKKSKTAQEQGTGAVLTQKWMITEMRGTTKEELIKFGAFISFNKDMNGSAYMGCNGISFQYKLNKAQGISMSNVLSTMRYCEDSSPIENRFSQEIVKAEYQYEIKGHFLYLKDSKGVYIKAIRPDWD